MNSNFYPRNNVSTEKLGIAQEFETTDQAAPPVLRRPVPLYPIISRNNPTAQRNEGPHTFPYSNSSNTEVAPKFSLPSISSFGSIVPENSSNHRLPPGMMSENLSSSLHESLTLPSPWSVPPRKLMSMPLGSSPGKQVLLPPAPDVGNPLNPKFTSHDLTPLKAINEDHHYNKPTSAAINLPSPPPSSNLLSPKLTGSNNFNFKALSPPTPASLLSPSSSPKSYPTDSYRSIQPKIDILSQPVHWSNRT